MPHIADFASSLKQSFAPSLLDAIEAAPQASLRDGPRHQPLIDLLQRGLGKESPLVPDSARMHCLSGLWLVAGDIDQSHTISQDLGDAEGSFLHGIMHRREGDFGNAKYWFRRVGRHSVFDQLASLTDGIYSDPFDFVDACSRASENDRPSLIDAQWIEWQSLMVYILDQA